MKPLNLVMFKKRDWFVIILLLFVVTISFFSNQEEYDLKGEPQSLEESRIGNICIMSLDSNGVVTKNLQEGQKGFVYIYYLSDPNSCISSSEFQERPTLIQVDDSTWQVKGGYIVAPKGRPRSPDCGGGVTVRSIGKLAAKSYKVKLFNRVLQVNVPNHDKDNCLTRFN